MKRILVAAGLAVAALSLPATAAMADGYEKRHVAKPKPKAKAKAKHHKKHHAEPKHRYRETVVDHARTYGAGHKVVHISKHEEYSKSYYEERDGHVVAHYGSYVNPAQGCYPGAPCTWGYGPRQPVAVSSGWGWWGHPGGVGYGVSGGYHGPVYAYPGYGSSSYSRSSAESYSKSKSYGRWSGGHHGMGGHHGAAGHHGVSVQHGGMMHGGVHQGPGGHHGMAGHHGVGVQHGPMHPGMQPMHPGMGGHHPGPGHHPGRGW